MACGGSASERCCWLYRVSDSAGDREASTSVADEGFKGRVVIFRDVKGC